MKIIAPEPQLLQKAKKAKKQHYKESEAKFFRKCFQLTALPNAKMSTTRQSMNDLQLVYFTRIKNYKINLATENNLENQKYYSTQHCYPDIFYLSYAVFQILNLLSMHMLLETFYLVVLLIICLQLNFQTATSSTE